MWKKIDENTPKDRPILAWCVHEADLYFREDGGLTLYGAHVEGLSHVMDGPNIIVWGGSWEDCEEDGGGYLPDWWFQCGSEFECAANPTHWFDIDIGSPPDAR